MLMLEDAIAWTDICIEQENRAAFVAECKIWKGPAKLRKAIRQLDGYLTWRDSKASLIVFSKNKDFNSVVSSVRACLEKDELVRSLQEITVFRMYPSVYFFLNVYIDFLTFFCLFSLNEQK